MRKLNITEEIPCDICGSRDSKAILTFPTHRIVSCRNCGLYYINPQPGPEELTKLYGSDYHYAYFLKNEKKIRARAKYRIKRITHYIKKGRIFDIGCMYGFFLDELQKIGWEVKGMEIAEKPTDYARQKLGLSVRKGNVEDSNLPVNSFDVVSCWHLLEHTRSPRLVLTKINRLLKPKGFIFLTLPNARALVAKIKPSSWPWFRAPEHLYHFNPRTIHRILVQTGYQVREITSHRGDADSLFSFLIQILKFNVSSTEQVVKYYRKYRKLQSIKKAIEKALTIIGLPFYPIRYLAWKLNLGAELWITAQKIE